MKKLLGTIIILIMFSSCGTTYYGTRGANGCGAWYPKRFEKDRSLQRVRNNPMSAYNRHGRGW